MSTIDSATCAVAATGIAPAPRPPRAGRPELSRPAADPPCGVQRRKQPDRHARRKRQCAGDDDVDVSWCSSGNGAPSGNIMRNRPIVHRAMRRLATAAANARTDDSVKSCTIRRARVAPRDSRVAISFERAVARASRRLATFTQAISSSSVVTARKMLGLARPQRSCSVRATRSRDGDLSL